MRQICLSTPWGQNLTYFRFMGSSFQDTGPFSKLPYLGMKLGHWQKFQKLHIYSLFYPRELIFSLFSLYGQWLPRYRPIFKIAMFGHETWPLTKDPTAALFLCTPGGRNWAFFAQRAAVSEITADFHNCHIWAWKLVTDKRFRICTSTLFLPPQGGQKLNLFSIYGQRFLT